MWKGGTPAGGGGRQATHKAPRPGRQATHKAPRPGGRGRAAEPAGEQGSSLRGRLPRGVCAPPCSAVLGSPLRRAPVVACARACLRAALPPPLCGSPPVPPREPPFCPPYFRPPSRGAFPLRAALGAEPSLSVPPPAPRGGYGCNHPWLQL